MKSPHHPRLGAIALAALFSLAGAAHSQQAPAPAVAASDAAVAKAKAAADAARSALERALANAKNPIAKPHPLLAQPFNAQVGPRLLATMDQMTATLAAVTAPAQAAPALAKIMQLWPQYQQQDKDLSAQLEQIAAAEQAGKKTPEMAAAQINLTTALASKGQALDAETLRVSKLPLAPQDMSALQNLRKALAE